MAASLKVARKILLLLIRFFWRLPWNFVAKKAKRNLTTNKICHKMVKKGLKLDFLDRKCLYFVKFLLTDVFWNGFYTRKSQFPCNYWNPQFLFLLLLPSRWSFARGRSLWIIICKRPALPDDHLQEASLSGSSFARGRPFRMTICKRPVPLDHHLQEASPPF